MIAIAASQVDYIVMRVQECCNDEGMHFGRKTAENFVLSTSNLILNVSVKYESSLLFKEKVAF